MKLLEAEVNQKSYIKVLCVCILFVIILLILNFSSLLFLKEFTLEEGTAVCDVGEGKMNVHIDSLTPSGKKVEIVGWAYKEDEEIRSINSSYVLKNRETGSMHLAQTRHETNLNVPQVYSRAGLHTRFLTGNLKSGTYDIYVLYKNNENNVLAKTGVHIDI